MALLLETVLFVFGLIALGYLSGVTGYLSTDTGEALSRFAVRVALPLLLFRTMGSADFQGGLPWAIWCAYFIAVIIAWIAGHLLVTRLFGRDGAAGVVGGVSSAFSNLLLIGIPFTQGVFGQKGFETLSLLLAIHLPTMMMASIILFQLFGGGGGQLRLAEAVEQFFSRTLRNPLIIGVLMGLLWRATGIAMPAVPARLVDSLAAIASPLALFAVGLSLRQYGLSGHFGPALALTAVKLVLMPAVALAASLWLGLSPLAAQVVVCAAALPAGVNSYLIAMQFGTGQALASNVMTIATALAILSISGWLLVLQAIYG
ncbi:MAG: AEC family transporter [Methylobacterium mesophilicum]|nr:AEC family transporter [Methylobacterium mesophilicum]